MNINRGWKVLKSDHIFENEWLSLFQDKIRMNNGKTMDYTWYKAPDVVVVVPFLDNSTLVMINQFRYPLQKVLLEFPAGHIETGETMHQSAKRELEEETGYTSNDIQYIYSYHPSISKTKQSVHVFKAKDLIEGKPRHDRTEDIRNIERMSIDKLAELVREKQIESAGTLIAFFICCYL